MSKTGFHQRFFLYALAMLVALASDARAAFILDDFDDPAVAVSPEMENELVVTENVGPLQAKRGVAVGGGRIDPIGRIDIQVTQESSLSATLDGHSGPPPSASAIIDFVFRYDDLPAIDVTQDGANDAIFFDIASISGTERPFFFRSFAWTETQPNEVFESLVTDLPLDSGPFTLTLPLSSYHFRTTNEGAADFTSLNSIAFAFTFFRFSEDIQWSMQLERVRFGKIPEPQSSVLALLTGAVLFGRRLISRGPFSMRRKTNVSKNMAINGYGDASSRSWSRL